MAEPVEATDEQHLRTVTERKALMPHMYILECADGSYYTGSTWDLEKRLWEHQSGQGANHTKKHLPVKLVYCEYYDRVEDAFYREKQIQGWSRRKKQALMEGNHEKLLEYARNYTQYGNPATAPASTSSASASATGAWESVSLPELACGEPAESVEGSDVDFYARTTQPPPEPVEGGTGHKHLDKFEGDWR